MIKSHESLPANWDWVKVGDLLKFEYGKALTKGNREVGGEFPVYGSNGIVGYHSKSFVDEPCLIIGRKGAAGAVHITKTPCWPIDTTYYVIPPENLNLAFLYYLLSALNLSKLDRSTAIPGLNREDAYSLEIPVPPYPEQERIVARIEELFSQLDAGTAALKRAKAQLKRYKASVLKAAVEGKLVPQEPNDEPVELLLRRFGKVPEQEVNLPPLPKNWGWISTKTITTKITDGTHFTPTYISEGIPFISVKDIFNGKVHFENCKYIPIAEHKKLIERCHPELFDVLVTKSGTIGRLAVVETDKEFSLFVSVALLKPISDIINSIYLTIAFENYINHIDIKQDVKGGVIKNLHIEDIKKIRLQLPPRSEQERIVSEVDRHLSIINELEKTIREGLERSKLLRQSILKRAFEGDLI